MNSAAARLAARSVPVPMTGCLLWEGSRGSIGYGTIAVYRNGVRHTVTTHRLAWELAHGPIPEGMMVRHTCDVRCCIAPAHLLLGTHAENMADMRERGGRKGKGLRATNPRAILTDVQVAMIVRDPRNASAVSVDYGVGAWWVRALRRRAARDVNGRKIGIQACRPEDRAMLATPEGAALVAAITAAMHEEDLQ